MSSMLSCLMADQGSDLPFVSEANPSLLVFDHGMFDSVCKFKVAMRSRFESSDDDVTLALTYLNLLSNAYLELTVTLRYPNVQAMQTSLHAHKSSPSWTHLHLDTMLKRGSQTTSRTKNGPRVSC